MMPHNIEVIAHGAMCRGNGWFYFQPQTGRTWSLFPSYR